MVRSFDRMPDRPINTALLDGDLWRIYRCVPEVHYAVNQQARLVGRLEWRIEIDSEEVQSNGTNPGADEILRRVFGADLRGITVNAAIHLQVTGRFYLVRLGPDGSRWKVLNSPLSTQQREDAERAADGGVLIEVVIEDPAIPNVADSPVRAIRDIATELILTRAQARATARNRTAQTMAVIYPREGAGPNPQKFEKSLAKVTTEPLSDEKATSVAVPNFFAWPKDSIADWRVLDFTGPVDERLHERVEQLIRQLAIGLDMAPSILLGLEDSNQWSAYASLEDNWLGHVEPLAAPVGQALAEALAKVAGIVEDSSRIEVIPDPAPLLRRRPSIADVLKAAELGIVQTWWVAEQLGAPDDAIGDGVPEPVASTDVEETSTDEPSLEQGQEETRQITSGPDAPRAAATTPTVTGERLANIDDQAYNSLEDLVLDTVQRALERLGAKIRSMAQGRNIDLPRDVSNADLARMYEGEIPNAADTVTQVAQDAVDRVTRVVHRAQGQLRALGIEVEDSPPEDPALTAAQAAFVAAIVGTVATQQEGGTGIAEAWEAARQIATIAGGGDGQDFRSAVSGIALAATTMSLIRNDLGLAPPVSEDSHRWLHLYQGPDPHPVHLTLNDALFNGVSVFAGGFVAFPGDHAGCQCIAVPARLINVRTGWQEIQPQIGETS